MFATYRKGDSYLHNLDSRTKLLLTAGMGIIVYLADPVKLGLLGAIVLLLAAVGGIPIASLLRGLRPIAIFIVLIFLTHLLVVSKGSVVAAAIPPARFILLILFTMILLHTTSQSELKTALAFFLRPLGRFGADCAFMIGLAVTFIPGLLLDRDVILRAQAARGCKPTGIAGFTALIVPLLRRSFRKADELSDALESRCYHRDAKRYYYGGALAGLDYASIVGFVAVLVLWVSI